MSNKRKASVDGESLSKKAKRQVSVVTAQKWQTTNDKEHQTLTWLKFRKDKSDLKQVCALYYDVCSRYSDYLQKWKSFSDTWIEGSTNLRLSNIQNHAKSEQHKRVVNRFHTDQA